MRFYDETSSERSHRALRAVEAIEAINTVETISSRAAPSDLPGLAIVGVGMMGREHLAVAHLLGRTTLRGIYDQSSQSLTQADLVMSKLGVDAPHRYPSLAAVFSDPTVDAIVISTPNFSHWEVVREALKSGKALLVEKPMATSLKDALAMFDAVQGYGALCQLGMQYRFKAQYVDVFAAIKNEKLLGGVKTISISEYRPPFLDKVEQWNKFNRFSGGTLVEKCCHYFDLINQMAESVPISVYASGGQAVNFLDFEYAGSAADIDDHAFVVINYRNGVRASFTLNMFCQDLYEEMIVVGEYGKAVASERATFSRDEPSVGHLQVEVRGHPSYFGGDLSYPEHIEASGHSGATYFAQEAFMNQLAGQAADGATPLQGLWAIIVATAAQESMHKQALVNVDELLQGFDTSTLELSKHRT